MSFIVCLCSYRLEYVPFLLSVDFVWKNELIAYDLLFVICKVFFILFAFVIFQFINFQVQQRNLERNSFICFDSHDRWLIYMIWKPQDQKLVVHDTCDPVVFISFLELHFEVKDRNPLFNFHVKSWK